MRISIITAVGLFCLASVSQAQESGFGFSVPITLTGGALYTHRLKTNDSSARPFTPGVRALLTPTVQFGEHWYGGASLNLSSKPFFPFQAYESEHQLFMRWIQAYVGYKYQSGRKGVTIKAGQLAVAFGSFPMRYEDDVNPLIDAPVGYGDGKYGALQYPISLYGLPGVEADVNVRNVDLRLQFVNSSPVNPRPLFGSGQTANWIAGAGYTLKPGLRIGTSLLRGGYLTTGRFLLPTENSADWPVTAVGVDLQWNTGHWTMNGEWQYFHLPYPRFTINPNLTIAYFEVKRNLSPRVYVAARIGTFPHSQLQPEESLTPVRYPPGRNAYEGAIGFRVNRDQLLKIGYELSVKEGVRGTLDNVFGIQFVTNLPALSMRFLTKP